MTATENLTARISANVYYVEIQVWTETHDQALELVASFPKSAGFRGVKSYVDGRVEGSASVRVKLSSDGTNGGRNETGIKRYRAARKALAAAGIPVTFLVYGNSLTEAELDERIA